jgi:hypothetical protein
MLQGDNWAFCENRILRVAKLRSVFPCKNTIRSDWFILRFEAERSKSFGGNYLPNWTASYPIHRRGNFRVILLKCCRAVETAVATTSRHHIHIIRVKAGAGSQSGGYDKWYYFLWRTSNRLQAIYVQRYRCSAHSTVHRSTFITFSL